MLTFGGVEWQETSFTLLWIIASSLPNKYDVWCKSPTNINYKRYCYIEMARDLQLLFLSFFTIELSGFFYRRILSHPFINSILPFSVIKNANSRIWFELNYFLKEFMILHWPDNNFHQSTHFIRWMLSQFSYLSSYLSFLKDKPNKFVQQKIEIN